MDESPLARGLEALLEIGFAFVESLLAGEENPSSVSAILRWRASGQASRKAFRSADRAMKVSGEDLRSGEVVARFAARGGRWPFRCLLVAVFN